MSRRWTRATHPRMCGGCGHPIAIGEPLLLIAIGVDKAIVKARCGRTKECDGPAPPDLPAFVPGPPPVTRLTPLRSLHFAHGALLPLDWKARQAADREPGEEG